MNDARFAAGLLDPDQSAPAGLSGPGGARDEAEWRYAVYRNNVTAGMIDTLAESFPAVRALVGETFFRAAAAEFVRAEPPRSPVMLRWGARFADWLAGFPPAQSVVYLPDVARLEWARIEAYHAQDAAALAPDALAAVPPEQLDGLCLTPHPAAHLLRADTPFATLWSASTGQGGAPDLTRPEAALVTRPDFAVETRILSRAQGDFIAALFSGAPLGAAAARVAEDIDLAAALGLLFASGAVADLRSERTVSHVS